MIHFALSHFPIALLMTGAALLAASAIGSAYAERLRVAAFVTLSAGAVMAIPTVAAGLWIASEHAGHHSDALSTHRLLGIATLATALAGVALHAVTSRIANADLVRNLVFVVAAILAGATGYAGAEMAHGGEGDHGEAAGHQNGDSEAAGVEDHHGNKGVGVGDHHGEKAAGAGDHHGEETIEEGSKAQPAKKAPHDHSTHRH